MNFNYRSLLIAACSALALSACGTISSVSSEGTTDEPIWPKVDSVGMNNKMGTFPDLTSLKEVKSGMSKDQLYHLLGRPHFAEGFFGVREWDYLFHFHTPGQGTNGVTTCQFKVLYDSNGLTNEFYWKAVEPVDATCFSGVTPARVAIDADALFAFDSSKLRPEGQRKLQEFVANLNQMGQFELVKVAGYTDRLGSDAYNLRLSQERADSVRNYLINLGVPSNKVSAQGYGKSNPVVQCDGSSSELITCLQPNRRVEIELKS